jgi:hypothetical protein
MNVKGMLSKTRLVPAVNLGACQQKILTGEFQVIDLPVDEIARQLTMWSWKRFYKTRRVELVDCAWDKASLRHRAPNLIALTEHYNKVSRWVERMILTSKTLRDRVEMMDMFVQLAKQLVDLENYFDGSAVCSAFDSHSIFRLNRHFLQLPDKTKLILENVKQVFSADRNFKALRTRQQTRLEHYEPVIPYFGLLQADLFKYYDALPTYNKGLINVRKVKGVYQFILRFEAFKKVQFEFRVINQIQSKIEELSGLSSNVAFLLSQQIETDDGVISDDISFDLLDEGEEEEEGQNDAGITTPE